MYHTGPTIEKTLDEISRRDLVLPAIQREFVWRSEQIAQLFDSLMQGYPFGTFLYWRIDACNSKNYDFYGFALDYDEWNSPRCPRLGLLDRRLTVVLDGQQRLTALNIGLRGSMVWKRPRLWRNNPKAFLKRRLYLDLLRKKEEDDDDGSAYRFKFLTKDEANNADEATCWFPVSEVLKLKNTGSAITNWLDNRRLPYEQKDQAHDQLSRLYRVIRIDRLFAYYDVDEQDLHTVLQIFIRMNSGGTVLSYSDLLLSVAVAQWKEHDAREEIYGLVDQLNRIGNGFSFSKDFVLKAGLMLSDIGSVGFKVDNFNKRNMRIVERNWTEIEQSLILTIELVADFGFTGKTLPATNAILPIAYYLYKSKRKSIYRTSKEFRDDRNIIHKWLIRSLLKRGIWGGSSDTLLTNLRKTIKKNKDDGFPDRIYKTMRRAGKSLDFEDDEIDEDLAEMRYQDKRVFALLSLLFPFVNLRHQIHVDHIFPKKRFSSSRLKRAGISEEKVDDFIDCKDRLANLQLLQGAENIDKRDKLPSEWLSEQFPDKRKRRAYCCDHLLPEIPDSIVDFDLFYDKRREKLKEKIKNLLD